MPPKLVLTLCFLLLQNALLAQSQIDQAIKALVDLPALAHGSVGVAVLDVESGKLMAGHDPHRSLTPASSLKVVTTGAALATLGPDFRFETWLQYDGHIDREGTLHGNLYLTGRGDPTLGSANMEGVPNLSEVMQLFCLEIQQAGIRKIDGLIVGDGSYFGTQGTSRTWAYEDLGNYYGAGAFGLNIQENLFFLRLQQKPRLGSQPGIAAIEPTIPNYLLINELSSAGKGTGDNAYIFGSPHTYTCFLRGTIPVGTGTFTIKGSIPDPAFMAAHLLLEALEKKGIATNKQATTQLELTLEDQTNTRDRKTIYTHYSPTLKAIVKETNLKSVNLFCEALLRMMGKRKNGDGSPEEGRKVMLDFWKIKGLDTSGFFVEDGSGLSPYNAVSAHHLATVMRLIARDEELLASFYDSLPIAGKSAALKHRLKGTRAANNLRAKSGGLNRVRSYTGIVQNTAGKQLTFSVIVNNFQGGSGKVLNKMEQFMKSLAD